MKETIETGLTIGTRSLELIDRTMDKIEKFQRIRKDTTTYLRLLYIEVLNNLEILRTISYENFTDIKANDEKLVTLLKLLQTEFLESIFYKSSENPDVELYRKLKRRGRVRNVKKELIATNRCGEEVSIDGAYINENVLKAISFVVTKIALLKKYTQLSDQEIEILKPVLIKTRIINIEQRLIMIKNVMGRFDEIREMA